MPMLAIPPYACRPMQITDETAVLAIDALSFPTPMKKNLLRHEVANNPLAHYQVLSVTRPAGEEIIGYAGYWLLGDEVHVSTIAVHPHRRGQGLGELLLLNLLLLAYAHPACLVTLEVRRSNVTAQRLYQKYQFKVVGERPGYYKDTGEDAVLMTLKPLNGRYYQFLNHRQTSLFRQLTSEA